jgi:hypothetical protein
MANKKSSVRWSAGLLALGLVIALVILTGCTSVSENAPDTTAPQTQVVDPAKVLEDRHGIAITGLGLTMLNSAIDFQYRVVYADKALGWLHDEELMPVLLDEDSGAQMPHPPEMMHTPNPLPGRIYHMLLPNSGSAIERGDRVSVLIGDLRIGPIQAQ